MRVENDEKDRHLVLCAARGLGKTEFSIRFLSWLCTRNNDIQGSEMIILTGTRQQHSDSLILRIKKLFPQIEFTSSMSEVTLNGTTIRSYPAMAEAGRGLPFLSACVFDEASYYPISEIQNALDLIQGYFAKSHPYCLVTSTPNVPGDLLDVLLKIPDEESSWRKLKMDYKYGENLIYTQADLMRVRKSSSYNREFLLRWSPKSGSTFNNFDIERAKCIFDTKPLEGNERTIAVDPASGVTGICITEIRDGDIYVLKSEEKIRMMHEQLSDYVYELWHQYSPISKLYIDASAVTFVKTMKSILGEITEYMDQIKTYKAAHANYALNMRCEPVFFTQYRKQEMLTLLKQVLEEGRLKIHSKEQENLLLFLFSATDTENILDKRAAMHNDEGDALMMNLLNYMK